MEVLILSWYMLTETGSVMLLTVYASLQFIGTLLSPMFGVVGDRIGHRKLLAIMRVIYACCATTLLAFIHAGVLTPWHVLAIATVFGLVRPSDVGMRAAVVGGVMPPALLMGAMGIQRTTMDAAKIVGALTGAGLVATLGMGPSYIAIVTLYAASALLTLKAGATAPSPRTVPAARTVQRSSPWRDLAAGLAYVRDRPLLLAIMLLAFLLNLTAFPLLHGLQPYVAKEIYGTDQTGLGHLVACASFGALTGSLMLSRFGDVLAPARLMLGACVAWFLVLGVYAHITDAGIGMPVLFLAGLAQSVSQVPMATTLLRNTEEHFRGRVMGIRMLAIYGNSLGLLLAGPLIAWWGYPAMATVYCAGGIAILVLIVFRWRRELWHSGAPANRK